MLTAEDYMRLAIEEAKKAAAERSEHQIDAEISLGDLYHDGNGVAQDFHKALEWYQKAKAHGASWLDDRIADCKAKMKESTFS